VKIIKMPTRCAEYEREILEALARESMPAKAIAEMLGTHLKDRTYARAKQALVEANKITCARSGRQQIYSLTEQVNN